MSTMRAAVLTTPGKAPTYTSVPALPSPEDGEVQLKVLATGLHNVVRSRASGAHYSSSSSSSGPIIPGVDGVGEDSNTGKRYYFMDFGKGATFAEYVNVQKANTTELPPSLDAAQVAGNVNPTMSSWMAITQRTSALRSGFTVFILGATSASGKLALHTAKALGAGKVYGAARSRSPALDGLDGFVAIDSSSPEKTDFSSLKDVEVDLVLDYLNGPVPRAFLTGHTQKTAMQYVHIGGLSGQEMDLPGATLRQKDITLRGAGPGSWSFKQLGVQMPELLKALQNIPEQEVVVRKLEEVEEAWDDKEAKGRMVFVP